jgi:hypothetical protein
LESIAGDFLNAHNFTLVKIQLTETEYREVKHPIPQNQEVSTSP